MIPLMRNAFLNEVETREALADFVRKAPRLSMSETCAAFEHTFAQLQGSQHAVLVNSGGSANLVMLQVCKNLGLLREGDKVGFSALTWSTNVMPIIQLGMTPVPIDCSPATLNCMAAAVEERLQETDLQALFITNALGFAGDLDAVQRLCRDRGIVLLEDNCEALGTELYAGRTGTFGLAASFSFFVAHHMSTIEGGMICSNDDAFIEMAKICRANGWDRNLLSAQQYRLRKQHGITSEFQAKYTFYDLGFNVRPTEITGFLGLQQLQYLDQNITVRERYYHMLEAVVKSNPDLRVLEHGHIKRLSSFAFPVVCKTAELRHRYCTQFSGAGIEIRPMIAGNIQRQPFYRKYVTTHYALPGTDEIDACGFYCGLYPDLTAEDLETIKSCLSRY